MGEALIQNKSGGTLDALSLTVNGYQMSFTNLGLTNNAYLTIDHLQTGGIFVKRARIGQASVLGGPTMTSSTESSGETTTTTTSEKRTRPSLTEEDDS